MTASARRRPERAAPANAEAIATAAHDALLLEVRTYPKPGLVSHVDCGSHDDMNACTFQRSVEAIRPYLAALVDAGTAVQPMATLRRIGIDAEAAMLRATGGINTHRGAIFCLGLLCAAAGARAAGRGAGRTVGTTVAARWGAEITSGPIPLHSHGSDALRRYGAGGARAEAAAGFPSLYRIGLPALRAGSQMCPDDPEAARVQCLFALIAGIRDTTLLHRGGIAGAAFAQAAARGFLDRGGVGRPDWRAEAERLHHRFVSRRLSPGGCADLMAASLFLDRIEAR